MNRLSAPIILAVLALALPSSAALAGETNGDGISVVSTRAQVVGHSPLRSRVVSHVVSVRVDLHDIDFATAAGWDQLNRRVWRSSREACDALDRAIEMSTDSAADCDGVAARTAMRAARENPARLAAAGSLTFRLASN